MFLKTTSKFYSLPLGTVRLSIDVMGGDLGPQPCILAALIFLANHSAVTIELIGQSDQIHDIVSTTSANLNSFPSVFSSFQKHKTSIENLLQSKRLVVLHAEQVVDMSEEPAHALRHKRSSSMSKTIERVAKGDADACVSGGNTGALLALSMHYIKTNSFIKRPAICKAIPTKNGQSFLLDLGANLDCDAFMLKQFALMASALVINKDKNVRVALLNIGVESNKGSSVIQRAAALLEGAEGIEFCGFIEGSKLFEGDVDVIVCDGHSGNIALKSSEGAADYISHTLKTFLNKSFIKRYLATLLKPCLDRLNPARFNGAMFLGLNKIVIKSHGGSDSLGFYHAIKAAHDLAESNVVDKVSNALSITHNSR